ncbi:MULTISPECIES: aminotransferase class I/II-fold pyridoxal phosphate-dependent enzyme [Shewanella]|uniref:8-amino-7-oxononanoate synthase n=1 Tax=Shewanella marisflavi TaxID=260364 RepID=A0ABX5WLW3_9GAMM|nr:MULTISPECIES: 8-amino-7-oxononanoate synthase [Shewanella]QDF75557.1 8-amino-7-oxononanoate synthase [Shewanella marisflavi]
MTRLDHKIHAKMQAAEAWGVLRQRKLLSQTAQSPGLITHEQELKRNFASNDYLGLSQSPDLIAALAEGARRYGVGSGASPLVTGYSQAHLELEQALCEATGHEAALLFSSGFSANSALMKTLFDKEAVVVADKLIHASLIDGLLESGAELRRFAHNDLAAAQRLVQKHQPVAVVTESVFSMDGDQAPVQALYDLAKANDAWLIVDDAHGFGVLPLGTGLAMTAACCDIQIVTFGKALGCQGAAILGSRTCIDFLVAHARDYIYSTALSPANAYVAKQAVLRVGEDTQLRERLKQVIDYFRSVCQQQGIELLGSETPIQPLVVGAIDTLSEVNANLKAAGFWVGAIRPPTVPQGSARLRITLNVNHSRADIDALVKQLNLVLREQGVTDKPKDA